MRGVHGQTIAPYRSEDSVERWPGRLAGPDDRLPAHRRPAGPLVASELASMPRQHAVWSERRLAEALRYGPDVARSGKEHNWIDRHRRAADQDLHEPGQVLGLLHIIVVRLVILADVVRRVS